MVSNEHEVVLFCVIVRVKLACCGALVNDSSSGLVLPSTILALGTNKKIYYLIS
eukprot:TRINITY_DN2514_c0_g1_i1.p1 TRINITY_DN2514_c0_g1~~TRINITY_DN2514_c0_g1_i1.p1  ORF type:complete len:54 (-),score=10.37 TRINITY_DN2514_c0_g1_i1:22-183(-)